VAERKLVGQIKVRLPGYRREIVVPSRILDEKRIHEVGPDERIDRAYQGLIAQVGVVPVAGRADAAAIEGVAHQHVQIARVHYPIMNGEPVVGGELLIEARESVVVVERLERAEIFRRQPQGHLGSLEYAQIADQRDRIRRRFTQPLPFIIGEEERPVLLERAAESSSVLAPAILIVLVGLQQRLRVPNLVAEIAVN